MQKDLSENHKIEDVAATRSATAASVTENIEGTPEETQSDRALYQSRTLQSGYPTSQRRLALLPSYPLGGKDMRPALLLLANVPNVDRNHLEEQSFRGAVCPFSLREHWFDETINSFMVQLYKEIFVEPSRRWNIDDYIIDYNLSRLRTCMVKYTEQTGRPAMSSLDELPMALEFYLQIDGQLVIVLVVLFPL
jgi:hypothetical protein